MKMTDVQKKAKGMGLKPGKKRKTALIRFIQESEGNNPCYQTEIADDCDQMNCCWREDCC